MAPPFPAATRYSWFVDEDINNGIAAAAVAGQVVETGFGQHRRVDEAFAVHIRGGPGQDLDRGAGHDLRAARWSRHVASIGEIGCRRRGEIRLRPAAGAY